MPLRPSNPPGLVLRPLATPTFAQPGAPDAAGLSYYPGGIAGWTAVYRAGTAGDSPSQFTDYSGHGSHATQATVGNQAALTTGVNGVAVFRNPRLVTAAETYWNLPASISIDRRNHGIWFVGRTRSLICNVSSRGVWDFGVALTDLGLDVFTGNTTADHVRTYGTTVQESPVLPARSGLSVIIASASAASAIIRYNGTQGTFTAYSAGSLTGGRLGQSVTLNIHAWDSEFYEFGIMPRAFTAAEMLALEADAVARYGRPLSPANQMVLAGDSLTEGAQATDQKGYAWLLYDALGATWQQHNQAVVSRLLSAMATAAPGLAALYDATKAKHVAILMGGTNDLAASVSGATCLTKAQTWATSLSGAGWSVLLCSVAARGDAGWTGAMETQRGVYNSGLGGLTGVASVVDVAGLPQLSDPTDTTYYYTDKVHWTNAGHAAVAALVQAAILAV